MSDFRKEIMRRSSRAVIAIHDYGCPPTTADGLRRLSDGIARREAALLAARERKGLHQEPKPEGD